MHRKKKHCIRATCFSKHCFRVTCRIKLLEMKHWKLSELLISSLFRNWRLEVFDRALYTGFLGRSVLNMCFNRWARYCMRCAACFRSHVTTNSPFSFFFQRRWLGLSEEIARIYVILCFHASLTTTARLRYAPKEDDNDQHRHYYIYIYN